MRVAKRKAKLLLIVGKGMRDEGSKLETSVGIFYDGYFTLIDLVVDN